MSIIVTVIIYHVDCTIIQLALVVMYSGFTTAHSFSGWYHEELSKQYVDVLNSEIISELANTTITALPGMYTSMFTK